MRPCIASALNPLAVVLCIEIADTQHAMRWAVRSFGIHISDETNEGRITFENHVKLAKLVASHAKWAFRVLLVPVHVVGDALDHRAPVSQITEPVFSMGCPQRGVVFIYEGLKDALDVSLDGPPISRAIILSAHRKR